MLGPHVKALLAALAGVGVGRGFVLSLLRHVSSKSSKAFETGLTVKAGSLIQGHGS